MICISLSSNSEREATGGSASCMSSFELASEPAVNSVFDNFEDCDAIRETDRAAGSVLRAALLVGCSLGVMGCGTSEDAASEEPPKMVFVDVKTGETRVLPATAEVPIVNPDTGRRTMMPAMYCETCAKWYPVPPAEQLNRARGAGTCPKHKTPLKAEGPMP